MGVGVIVMLLNVPQVVVYSPHRQGSPTPAHQVPPPRYPLAYYPNFTVIKNNYLCSCHLCRVVT